MILIIIIILILILIINLNHDYQDNNYRENYYQDNQDYNLDLNYIKKLTKDISIYRPVESDNLKKVKNIVMNELKKLNLDVEEQKFTRYIRGKNYSFSNIIAKNKLVNDNYIILGCHIDGPQIDNIEATTDAVTCISFIIEIVKKLLINNEKYPVMVVFFDGEEAIDGEWTNDNTLSGSNYFVDHFNKNIKFLIIFDLIGGDIYKNKIIHYNNNSNKKYMKQLANINKKYNKQIFVDPEVETSSIKVLNDYTPFIKKYNNLSGLNLIPATFPDNHHNINDNYNNVNWEYIDIFSNVVYEFLLKFNF
jgi:hypothetical protein